MTMLLKEMSMKKLSSILMLLMLVGCGQAEYTTSKSSPCPAPLPAPTVGKVANISCEVYDLNSVGLSSMPDFDTLPGVKVLALAIDRFDVVNSSNAIPFPKFVGTSAEPLREKFGLKCISKLNVVTSGNHTLKLTSDDGAKLFINGALIINHDGLHVSTSKTAVVNLGAGIHDIKVEYYNNLGFKSLLLSWIRPGGVETLIDKEDFVK